LIFNKPTPFYKPTPSLGAKHYFNHTHKISWQNSNSNIFRPFHQTLGVPNSDLSTHSKKPLDFSQNPHSSGQPQLPLASSLSSHAFAPLFLDEINQDKAML
jgi:hypothetical protein